MTTWPRVFPRAAAKVVAGAMTLLIVAACGANKEDEMKDAFEALLKRPSITQVEADYQSMFQTIRERLISEVGVAEWVPDDEPMSSSACAGSIANLGDAEVRRYDAGMSPGNLPDAKWKQAVAIVTEVARQHAFGAPEVIVSGPSDHEVSFRNAYNGELLFGTGANTILGGSTGCHLSAEAHDRGTYLPPKKY
jgi:hypothetical protein